MEKLFFATLRKLLPKSTLVLQVVFTLFAFGAMVIISYFIMSTTIRSQLSRNSEAALDLAMAQIEAELRGPEPTLRIFAETVQQRLLEGADLNDIMEFLNSFSAHLSYYSKDKASPITLFGIFFTLGDEPIFLHSSGWTQFEGYDHRIRPWYQAAMAGGGNPARSELFFDYSWEQYVCAIAQSIQDESGRLLGVVSLQVPVDLMGEIVIKTAQEQGGYGMIMSQDLIVHAHVNHAYIGMQVPDPVLPFSIFYDNFVKGEDVFERPVISFAGEESLAFFRQTSDGWYYGTVVPSAPYFESITNVWYALIALGVGGAVFLIIILVSTDIQKNRATALTNAKSQFLAAMSHEIRTPMNAISGMAELLLRRDLPDEAKAEALDIKQAATNLISIINDILDFSKIESGKLEIIPVKYMLLSLINDTVNIIRMRLTEKPIEFYTNIDGNIPNSLIGDEIRMRQILLNLLSNAVKYTEKGHISLTIIVQKRVEEQVWLEITISDTGKGIKLEDQAKLFGSFVQVDLKKNRNIEGTGLGLAITRQLCLAMNGNITFQSEYGKGSEFKAVIPQGVDSEKAFAAVEEPKKKRVLVYDRRAVYAKSVCWSLENLGVPYIVVETMEEFAESLLREEWYYVFSGYGLYEEIKPLIAKAPSPSGNKPPVALLVEWGNEAHIPNVRFISLPVQSLSIANVLNGNEDTRSYFNAQNSSLTRFTYPKARLLVVDDISTNLRVAEGLLAPYHAKIDTALSGAMAIELVKQHEYDIVFMDHMMPEMDGIEATAQIRSWEEVIDKTRPRLGADAVTKQTHVPIVALTANAVSGMKEMFIKEGFSDFLAKPIDISKLDEILARWIVKEKRGIRNEELEIRNETVPYSPLPTPHSLPPIPGIDVQHGIANTGGTIALYREVLLSFCKDVEERLPILKNVPKAAALPKFTTEVHALKSVSASMGASDISAMAAKLEAAGKDVDIDFIRENLPGFTGQLVELVKEIEAWESAVKEGDSVSNGADLTRLLHELSAALETERAGDIDRILEELMQQTADAKQPINTEIKAALEKISDNVLMAEFESAAEIVRTLLKGQV